MHHKKLLILDLDETLIHARHDGGVDGDWCLAEYSIICRPHLWEFLRCVAGVYDLAIWSAASDMYVERIISHIQRRFHIDFVFVWARSRCSYIHHWGIYDSVHQSRKNIRKVVRAFGYAIEDILIVDDDPEKLVDNYGNAIYIQKFEGDAWDDHLPALAQYLINIRNTPNFRMLEKRFWRSSDDLLSP